MIENSFENGALQSFNNAHNEIHAFLCNYWSAVNEYYNNAWNLRPRESRLTHGVGIISMGYIMDAISYKLSNQWKIPPARIFKKELETLGGDISWTKGVWRFSKDMILPWDELQNNGRHIDLVTNYLIRKYRS